MNWKTGLQISDLDAGQRLEMTCQRCGHVYFLTPSQLMINPERRFLYLDEVEREAICKARGCNGKIRLALLRNGGTSGFVGGMA